MKKILLLYFFIVPWNFLSAQNSKVDSLQRVLKAAGHDTIRVNVLAKISEEYWDNNFDSIIKYAGQSLELSKHINFKKGIGTAYNSMARAYRFKREFAQAMELVVKAIEASEEALDKMGLSTSWNNKGNILYLQSNYTEALKSYFTGLKIAEEIGYSVVIANCNNNIGSIYFGQKNFAEALKCYTTSLQIAEVSGDKNAIESAYNNVGITYEEMGNYTEALKNLTASLKICLELKDKKRIADSFVNLGYFFFQRDNYSEAIVNTNKAINIQQSINDKQGQSFSYMTLGSIDFKQKKYEDASYNLNKALTLAKEINDITQMKNIYGKLSALDSAGGDYKQAFEYYRLFVAYRDSIFNEENTKKIVEAQMQYDFDKKEAATKSEQDIKDVVAHKELQKQKLVRNGFIGGFAVVLLFAGVFFTQRNKIKKEKQRSDELLLNILPEEVAEELKAKGSAEAKQFDDVTVMFTDFKNFTQISEKLSPTELVNEIHTCFKAFDNIITKHNIEKIKTIGDAYMCAGGLPVTNTTNATDVVNAAMEIQQFMQQHLQQRKNDGKEVFEIRIGIHTGPVVAGIVGVKKFAYDIWGDTVNIASRMESSGEAGKVNISGSTYELVKDKFTSSGSSSHLLQKEKGSGKFIFIHRGKIQAKNKGEIDMYFVESHS